MTEERGYTPPPWREQIQAVLLAALCSLCFLGTALVPGYAVMPFPPEALEPMRTEALGDGLFTADQLARGNPSFGDKYNQSLTWDRISGDRLRDAGSLPLWTRDIAGGAPFVPQMGQVYQPWTWMLAAIPVPGVYGIWYLLHQVLFSWFSYRFLRRIGTSHGAALLGVVCVGIGLWTQARVHHNVILSAALPLFAMLSCVHQLCVYRGGARTAGWLALGTGISWLGGMPQVSLMVTALAVGYGSLLAWRQSVGYRLRPLLWMALAVGVGGLVGLAQMGPVLVAKGLTSRVVAPELLEATLAIKALEWDHVLNAVWPDLLAWPAEQWYFDGAELVRTPWAKLLLIDWSRINTDHAHNYPETAFAIGIPALALACAGLANRRLRVDALFFGVVAVSSFLWATGCQPLLWLATVIPGLRDGDLKRLLFPCAMALAVLAALGMDRLGERRTLRPALVCAGAILVASAGFWLYHLASPETIQERFAVWTTSGHEVLRPEHFHKEVNPGEADANRDRLLATFGRATLIALGAVVLLLVRRPRIAALGLMALTAIDLLLSGHGTIVAIENERVMAAPRILEPAIAASRAAPGARPRFQRLVQQAGDVVAGSLLRPNRGAFFGLEDLAAYNPQSPRRMDEFFEAIEPPVPGQRGIALAGAGIDQFRQPASMMHPLVDLIGLEWVLTDGELDLPGHVDRTPSGYPHRYRLYQRTTAMPRATFVTRARLLEDREVRLGALGVRTSNPRDEVILEDPDAPIPSAAVLTPATVEMVRHDDERVEVRVSNAQPGYLRLADPWDPGWTATVDGESAPVFVADHYLRAVYLEPGEHDVTFRYDGGVVVWPRRLAVLGLLGVLLLLLAPALRGRIPGRANS